MQQMVPGLEGSDLLAGKASRRDDVGILRDFTQSYISRFNRIWQMTARLHSPLYRQDEI